MTYDNKAIIKLDVLPLNYKNFWSLFNDDLVFKSRLYSKSI